MAAAGMLTKGITLGYSTTGEGTYTNLPNLQTVPALGGDIDKVETTVLSDASRTYINGLIDYGDLEFGFVYDADQTESSFKMLKTIEESGKQAHFQVGFPDGSKFNFIGQVHVATGEANVGDVVLFTAQIGLGSDIEYVAPAGGAGA